MPYIYKIINQINGKIYSVEDINGAYVDKYHYEISFLPEMIVPITFTSNN